MVSGKVYCLSFYVSRADRNQYAIKQIGALFSSSLPSMVSNMYINAIPQVVNTSGFISDTTQWTQIQDCFTALGGEQYVTFGNFNSNTNTDTLYVGTNNGDPNYPNFKYSYYYFDDMWLIDQTTVDVKDITYKLGVMNVYPNPAKDELNIELGAIKESTEVKIYNTLGELVLTEPISTHQSSLNIHHLLSGIYFYRILVKDKIIKTDKIVIIK